MKRVILRAGYSIVVGAAMLGFWALVLATGRVPELATEPYEIGYHLVAEGLTALALLAAGVGLVRRAPWGRCLYPIALGMLLYTVINSAGYYAQLGDPAMVGLFTGLTGTTLLLIADYLVRRALTTPSMPPASDLDV